MDIDIKYNNMGKQNQELLKNIEKYEQKEKIKQQKPKVYGQKPVKRETNSKESARMYNS